MAGPRHRHQLSLVICRIAHRADFRPLPLGVAFAFGSALNAHVLRDRRVFSAEEDGQVRFREASALTPDDIR
jgi:hypothetical protein